MRIIVTPAFSEKATSSGADVLKRVQAAMETVANATRDELVSLLDPLLGSELGIHVLKRPGLKIILSFGHDGEGEYALLADLIVAGDQAVRPLPHRDPTRNMMIDPNRNMMIDPRRNMMIDPNRNMMIDPRRNMTIDPNRNMMIDPNRNMMIDPNRNMMIDPNRNMMIDPSRNWMIDPRRNSTWDGPQLHKTDGSVSGFFIRGSDKVALLFDASSKFLGPVVAAGTNYNSFDNRGRWTGFFVPNGKGGLNQFDTSGRWLGYVVDDLLPQPS